MIAGVSEMIAAKYRFWWGFFFSFILVVVWRVSAEILCVEGRALIKFIGSIL